MRFMLGKQTTRFEDGLKCFRYRQGCVKTGKRGEYKDQRSHAVSGLFSELDDSFFYLEMEEQEKGMKSSLVHNMNTILQRSRGTWLRKPQSQRNKGIKVAC